MRKPLPGRAALILATSILACAGEKPAPRPPAAPATLAAPAEPPPEQQPTSSDPLILVDWLIGPWEVRARTGGAIEHWRRIGEVLHGVGFATADGRTSFFEVLTVANQGGRLVYTAMPRGLRSVDFPAREVRADLAVFANPAHDFPQVLRYERAGDALSAQASAPGSPTQAFRWSLGPQGRSPNLEKADRAFAADVAARGLDAWAAWFDPTSGAQWTSELASGRDAIRAAVAPDFARRNYKMEWTPIASGLSPAGDLGYTTGIWAASWTGDDGPHNPCGSYVTVWRRQPDGSWLALFHRGWPGKCPADWAPQPANPA